MRATNLALAGLCLLMLALATIVHVDVVVQGSGQLTIDVPPIVLQPMERAIVRSLNVKVGDSVYVRATRVPEIAGSTQLPEPDDKLTAQTP